MRHHHRTPAFGVLTAFALACGDTPAPNEHPGRGYTAAERSRATLSTAPVLAIDGEGLRLVDPAGGRTTPLPFGTPEPRVLDALERSEQALRTEGGATRACVAAGVQARTWPGGFTAVFHSGAFVGWELDERSDGTITTPSGVGIGATREYLEWSYVPHVRREVEGSSFTAGELRGTFEGDGSNARIQAMWAGTTCEPRAPLAALEPVTPETHGVVFEGIPPFADLVASRDGDWFVVLGSFPVAPGAEPGRPGSAGRTATLMRSTDSRAAALQQRLWNAGVVPFAVRSDVLPNFTPGMIVLVAGPYQRAQAEESLESLRAVVPDAYLKSGW